MEIVKKEQKTRIVQTRRYAGEEKRSRDSFFAFAEKIINQKVTLGKVRISEAYTSALRSFSHFRNGKDLPLSGMTSDLLALYEAWLHNRGVTRNTISFYMRILRAIFNRGVKSGLVKKTNPFHNVYTGVEKTRKRAVSSQTIRQIRQLLLPAGSSLDFARDMFLFSFYTRGMSFVDMAYLRRRDLVGNTLAYSRRKTGQKLYIGWEKCMQDIVDKYHTTSYLLPIVEGKEDTRRSYINALHLVNSRLKDISVMLNIVPPLTMYVARHSWASIAKCMDVPVSVISEAMGHDSETTTLIYLASFDHSVIDKANRKILERIKG